MLTYINFCFRYLGLSSCASKNENSGGNINNPVVTMTFKDFGTVKIELYPDMAPNTVNNFISLVKNKFYDGLIIHRVEDPFVIQGGDPNGDGSGGPGYVIKGEFAENGFKKNTLSHTKGVISMARRSTPNDSAGSQFFIVLSDDAKSSLDNKYAGFGKVIEGLDVIDKISKVEISTKTKRPITNVVIESATVDTFGVNYKEPTKLPDLKN
jgi:peptidyl-prolyl cis-trans isomerase B (cyclophilin B)